MKLSNIHHVNYDNIHLVYLQKMRVELKHRVKQLGSFDASVPYHSHPAPLSTGHCAVRLFQLTVS